MGRESPKQKGRVSGRSDGSGSTDDRVIAVEIAPGLPPPGFGVSARLVDLLEGQCEELLLNPDKC
jgi:hypothetical protein